MLPAEEVDQMRNAMRAMASELQDEFQEDPDDRPKVVAALKHPCWQIKCQFLEFQHDKTPPFTSKRGLAQIDLLHHPKVRRVSSLEVVMHEQNAREPMSSERPGSLLEETRNARQPGAPWHNVSTQSSPSVWPLN